MYGIHEVIKNDSLSLGSWVGYVPITSNKEVKKIWIVEEKRTETQFLQEGPEPDNLFITLVGELFPTYFYLRSRSYTIGIYAYFFPASTVAVGDDDQCSVSH